jgi:hypothetical protein
MLLRLIILPVSVCPHYRILYIYTKVVHIISIFVFFFFSRNYRLLNFVHFCVILHISICFVCPTPLKVFKVEALYFTGYLYINQKCAYYQDFYFLQFFASVQVTIHCTVCTDISDVKVLCNGMSQSSL